MKSVDDLKWYTTFFFLIGAILSFADPVTDALTLAEFYKENHMRWFKWGLTFMIVPCAVFVIVSILTTNYDSMRGVTDYLQRLLFSFNPFSPAWASFKSFVFCLKNFKKLWRGEEVDCEDHEIDDVNRLILYVRLAPFTEAITESVPQFIIQLYAASVQEEPVKIIQIISLSVSCLSIVWTFTGADELIHDGEIEVTIKHKVLFFVANLFLLTSRLFSICYFIMDFRGLIFVVLVFHSVIVGLVDSSSRCKTGDNRCRLLFIFFLMFHWIKDDLSAPLDAEDMGSRRRQLRRIQWLSHVMFVMENFAMILLFYNLSKYSNTRYALPVTVYVCTASILGTSLRLVHFRFLLKGRVAPEASVTNEELEAVGLAIQQELMNAYALVQAWQSAHERRIPYVVSGVSADVPRSNRLT